MSKRHNNANPQPWNSLELVKLGVSVAVPLVIAVLGDVIWNAQRDVVQRWENSQAEDRRIAEAQMKERDQIRDFRLSIYKRAAPLLNDIFAYHFYVGRWKEISPAALVEEKRQLDEILYPHRVLFFSSSFFARYHMFMSQSFRSAGDHLGASSIRTRMECRRPHLPEAEKWLSYFTNEDMRPSLCIAYSILQESMTEELLLQSIKTPRSLETKPLSPPIYDTEPC